MQMFMFKPFEYKGEKILTVYKVHFQRQKAETVRLRVKVHCGRLFTPPQVSLTVTIYDNTDLDNTNHTLSKSTFRF